MKIKKLTTAILLSVIVTGWALPSLARHGHSNDKGHGMHHGGMNVERAMHHLSKLDLSEQQEIDIEVLVKQGIEVANAKRKEIKSLKKQLKKQSHSDVIDEKRIKNLTLQIGELKGELMILHLNKRNSVKELLTAEQQEKFKEMKKRRMKD